MILDTQGKDTVVIDADVTPATAAAAVAVAVLGEDGDAAHTAASIPTVATEQQVDRFDGCIIYTMKTSYLMLQTL